MEKASIGTKCVQGGYRPGNGQPRQIPIIQSTTFKYDTGDAMGKLFDLEASGYFYSRLQNPTVDAVAAKICELEGGTAAMLTSSGMAANFLAVFNICSCGDHIVSSSAVYGGTYNLFAVTMKRMGISVTFVPPDCSPETLDAAFQPRTKAVFGETIANPALHVLDIEKFAAAAHAHGRTPYRGQHVPHARQLPTVRLGSGTSSPTPPPNTWTGTAAPWAARLSIPATLTGRSTRREYPGLCTPDESYHGVVYTERFGLECAYITKATAQLMRDLGVTPSPMSAYFLNLGLESLHVRMRRHCENALAVARFLQGHEQISWVAIPRPARQPGISARSKIYAKRYMRRRQLRRQGRQRGGQHADGKPQLIAIETHVADARSCCLHPATTTHRK